MSEFVLVKGARSKLLWANRAFREYYGLSNEQLRQLVDADHSDPDDTLQYVRDDHQVYTTGKPVEVVEPVSRHDGAVGYYRTIKTQLVSNGLVIGTVGTSRPEQDAEELAESKAGRIERKDSSSTLQALVRSLPASAIVLDAKQRVVATSERFVAMFGLTDNVVGAAYDGVLGEKLPIAQAVEGAISCGEATDALELAEPDGGRSFRIAVEPWTLPNEKTLGALVQFSDVTRERRAEDEVRASNRHLRAANLEIERSRGELERTLASLTVGALVLDREGKVTSSNAAASELLGNMSLEGDLRTWVERLRLVDDDGKALGAEGSPPALALEGKTTKDRWLRLAGPESSPERWVSVSATPILGETASAAVVTLADVSQRYRAQRELEEFAYIASHDLQEPLRMVRSFMSLLRESHWEQLDEDGRQYVDFAKDGAERMTVLVRELLEFSRAGGSPLRVEEVNTTDLLRKVTDDFAANLEKSGGTIEYGPLPNVVADDSHLRQVIHNLVGNALKFSDQARTPLVKIRVNDAGGMWKFEVEDNGIGIDSRHGAKVFRMFQRLHSRAEFEGSGIGLAICKRVIERHGGAIGFHSGPGRGTTFWFTLPKTP